MKVFLMHPDRDFDLQRKIPWNQETLTKDLALNTLFNAMAQGDDFLSEVAKKAFFSSLSDPGEIRYRQDILKDCLNKPSVVKEIYDISLQSIESRRSLWWFGNFGRYPSSTLSNSRKMLQVYVGCLKELKHIADEHAGDFRSEGFRTFFAMIRRELDDDYIIGVQDHLRRLEFRDGIPISAELGPGNEGDNYVLLKPKDIERNWIKRIFAMKTDKFTYTLDERDESGARALSELRDRGINLVANALAQSASHVDHFFGLLRTELAFYIGCLNLHDDLDRIGAPVVFPTPLDRVRGHRMSFRELYDVCLALTMGRKVVGNDVDADGKNPVIITGANQGGKSTFLRSVGLAQLMMQCGMFVPAGAFCSTVCDGVFTHYKREEDASMKSGKLDEELRRMSDIVEKVKPNSMILFNESLAATNEREGSEIAGQIVRALSEKGIRILFVTHMYELTRSLHATQKDGTLFLRAGRQVNGERTFKITEGKPLQTSYGEDLYKEIFAASAQTIAVENGG